MIPFLPLAISADAIARPICACPSSKRGWMFGSWGSLYGGTNIRAPRGPIWCMSWVICGL